VSLCVSACLCLMVSGCVYLSLCASGGISVGVSLCTCVRVDPSPRLNDHSPVIKVFAVDVMDHVTFSEGVVLISNILQREQIR